MTETQAWLLILIAVVSAAIGAAAVFLHRRTAKQQATLTFIDNFNHDPRTSAGYRVIRKYADGDIKNITVDERDNLLILLNRFEILAVGLASRIYDQEMVEKFFARDLHLLYDSAAKIIAAIRKRENDPEAFAELERLALRRKSRAQPGA